MQRCFSCVRRMTMAVATVLIVISAVVTFCVTKDPRPKEPVLLLTYPYRQPAGWGDWVEAKIPMSWSWFWRFRDRFRGPAVLLEMWVVELKTSGVDGCNALVIDPQRELGLGQPYLGSTNGTMVWRLTPDEVSHLWSGLKRRNDVQMLTSPRMSTSDSIPSSMWWGNTLSVRGTNVDVGLKVDLYPRVKGDHLDLLGEVMSSELLTNSETVRTNIALAARMQLGNRCGVFLRRTNAAGYVYGIIFSGSWTQPTRGGQKAQP